MSYELLVYSALPPLEDETDVRQHLLAVGWDVVFVRTTIRFRVVPARDASVAIGIPAGSPHRAAIDAVMAAGDRVAFQKLYGEERLTACTMYVSPVTSETKAEMDSVAGEDEAEPYADRIRATQTVYVFETQASRNGIAVRFQRSLWASFGAATLGVLEDPEENEFTDIPGES